MTRLRYHPHRPLSSLDVRIDSLSSQRADMSIILRFFIGARSNKHLLSNMKKEHIIFFVIFATFLVSFVSLGISCYRTEVDLDLDYMGVIVGILALLVTVLIGLQLYNYIFARENIKLIVDEQVKKMIEDYEQVTKARDLLIEGFEYLVSEFVNEKITDHIIRSLQELDKCQNGIMKERCLDYVMEEAHKLCTVYTEVNGRKIYKNRKPDYLYVLKKVDHKYTLELINYIEKAEEVEPQKS